MHRHVDAIAVAVLEHQELVELAGDLHGLQPHVAADAIGLVHHRCAGFQALQIAQDGRRVGGGCAPPTALLAGARCQTAAISVSSSSAGSASASPRDVLGHVDGKLRIARRRTAPRTARHAACGRAAASISCNHFAAPGRVGGDQYPARKAGRESSSAVRAVALARASSRKSRRRGGREVCVPSSRVGVPARPRSARARHPRRERDQPAASSAGSQKASPGGSSGPLDVVPAILVALADVLPGPLQRCIEVRHRRRSPASTRQVVGEVRRAPRRTAADRTRCRGGAMPSLTPR